MEDGRHYATLDGVRGFAALSVVLFHIGHWLGSPLAPNSGLAVDLFFLLSGYVLTLAYQYRLATTMSARRFTVIRIIRLMPLVVLATLISAAYAIVRIHVKHEDVAVSAMVFATLLGILNIPYLTAPLPIGGNQIFPLNGPQYSLFLEIVCNTVWAAFGRMSRLIPAALGAAVCFVVLAAAGGLGGDTPGTFLAGFPRVGASFLGGVALYHVERALPMWRGWTAVFWGCALVMVALFYFPSALPFGVQLAWVGLASPLLVLSGARTPLHGRARAFALLAGKLSYPIYVLHYPMFTWINGLFQGVTHRQNIVIEGAMLVVTVVMGSIVILQFYDEPVRRKLSSLLYSRR
ncbi:MAG: acyltransferase family protein [Janthinobacterium lividum]